MLVLITACANLGNLLLARGQAREREISIRVSVGAGPWRIIRQLMVENLVLALLGSAAGLVAGQAGAKLLLSLVEAPPDLRLVTDWRITGAGAALAVFSALVFGLAPARQAVRRKFSSGRARQTLLAVQVAASCFLLILAGLLARTIDRRLALDVRFDYARMLVVDPQLSTLGLPGPAARQALDETAARLRQLPGVTAVGTAISPPFGGRLMVDMHAGRRVAYNQVEPPYFELMNLPVVRGRVFTANEPDVVVLSESAARAFWPDQDPLGQSLDIPKFMLDSIDSGKSHIRGTEKRTVVGVVMDSGAATGPTVEAYLPLRDADAAKAMLMVRTGGDPAGIVKDARTAASSRGVAPSVAILRTALERDQGKQRGVTQGVGSLGATATLLAAVGIFGLTAFAVAQRTREIGIRLALGASPAHVLGTLLGQYSKAMGAGAVAGVALAAGVARLLGSNVLGIRALDPVSYLTALALFGAVAPAAILIPARRALRIDPASALRWE
jgi:predicted permease